VPADRFLRAAALVALSTTLTACDWFTTFRHQPRLEPWENMTISADTSAKLYWRDGQGLVFPVSADEDSVNLTFRGNPSESVPVTGTYLAPWQVSYAALPNVIDSIGNAVKNPVAPTPQSLELGRKYYQINCAVCHGDNGMGAQTIVAQYGLAFPIATDMTKNDPQRAWPDAELQPDRGRGPLARRELRARPAGQVRRGAGAGGLPRPDRRCASRRDRDGPDAPRAVPDAEARHGDGRARRGGGRCRSPGRPGQGEELTWVADTVTAMCRRARS